MSEKTEDTFKNVQSMGIGITNTCNLNCKHCYSRTMAKDNISLLELKDILKRFPNLSAVNLGTGESLLNKEFLPIIRELSKRKIKIALTSNGYTIEKLSDEIISLISEVDISIDFPDEKLHDEFRGVKNTYQTAISSIKRLKKLKIDVSIATALMNINYKYLPEFKQLIKKYEIPLRLNIYKPVNKEKFGLSYDQFWESMKILSENFTFISCSEPILSIITKLPQNGSPCGNSLRLHPNKVLTACVYLDGNKTTVETFKKIKESVPEYCINCEYSSWCMGGCVGRRILNSTPEKPDQYCPFFNNKPIPNIKFRFSNTKEYIHSSYLCTIIVS